MTTEEILQISAHFSHCWCSVPVPNAFGMLVTDTHYTTVPLLLFPCRPASSLEGKISQLN